MLQVMINSDSRITSDFFARVQNKIIFAVTGKTAAEIINERANSENLHMGLATWKGSPNSKIHASDVVISKNYLFAEELKTADRLADGFLIIAEMRVDTQRAKEKPLLLKDWSKLLEDYIKLNQFEVLEDKGNIVKKTSGKVC